MKMLLSPAFGHFFLSLNGIEEERHKLLFWLLKFIVIRLSYKLGNEFILLLVLITVELKNTLL
jgi:hypothetical protein